MADDFKKQGMRSREWGRKARKAMKRSARIAIKRDTAKELACEDIVYAQLIEALEYDEPCEQGCAQPGVLYGVETDPALLPLWKGITITGRYISSHYAHANLRYHYTDIGGRRSSRKRTC